jgi:glycosyltransferase involved in cell wall biosynthesis
VSDARYPDLSIVIPAFRTGRALDMTLRALANTETGPETFEVIVVDDGSEESLRPVVDAYQQIPASYIRLARNSGRAAARNVGAGQAHGKRLLFLDSDSYPLKGLVHGHATFGTGDREGTALLGSRIDPGWRRLAEAIACREVTKLVEAHEDDLRHLGGGEAGAINFMRHRAPWMYCYTNNLSVPRGTFTELGGFDEAFTDWGFEDVEFGYRLFLSRNRDGGFEYRPDITCMHLPQFRNRRAIGRASMRSIRYLKRKHPCFDVELVGTDVNPRVESKIRYYEDIFTGLRRVGLGLSAAGVTRLLPEAGQQKVLWIGAGLGMADEGQSQIDHMRDASGHNLHLLGIDTPFEEQEFEAVINVDLWRFLVPQDLSLAITEGLRIGKRLLLVASARLRYSENGLGMADLDYFAEAYGFSRHIQTIKTDLDGKVLHVTAQ